MDILAGGLIVDILEEDVIRGLIAQAIETPAIDSLPPYYAFKRRIDRVAAEYAHKQCGYNITKAADLLGVHRDTFRKMLEG